MPNTEISEAVMLEYGCFIRLLIVDLLYNIMIYRNFKKTTIIFVMKTHHECASINRILSPYFFFNGQV